jgi:hypothetical protein
VHRKSHAKQITYPRNSPQNWMTITLFAGSCSGGNITSMLRSACITLKVVLLPSSDKCNPESSVTRDSHYHTSFLLGNKGTTCTATSCSLVSSFQKMKLKLFTTCTGKLDRLLSLGPLYFAMQHDLLASWVRVSSTK